MKVPSLKLTAKAPENGWLEYLFPFGSFWYCFFQGAIVSFMEGNSLEYAKASITNNTWNLFLTLEEPGSPFFTNFLFVRDILLAFLVWTAHEQNSEAFTKAFLYGPLTVRLGRLVLVVFCSSSLSFPGTWNWVPAKWTDSVLRCHLLFLDG